MRPFLQWFKRYPILQTILIVAGLLYWANTGALNPTLARADGPCGHFCMDGFSGDGYQAVCSVCGCEGGQGFVGCPEEMPTCSRCVYCCIGCPPPPEAPPGSNGCWGPAPEPQPTATPNCNIFSGPPTLGEVSWTPNFPVVVGQKSDSLLTALFTARGGPSQTCSNVNAPIVRLQVERIDLSPGSAAWITTELAKAYPGAQVKESYPLNPNPPTSVSGLGTSNATGQVTFPPADPGWYELLVTAEQSDGQTVQTTYRVPAYLLGSTLIR